MEEVKEVEQPKLDSMRPCPECPKCGTQMKPLADMCICPRKECAEKLPRRSWGKCVACEQRKAAMEARRGATLNQFLVHETAGQNS